MKAWNDKCAVFGVYNDPEAVWMTYLGLYAQQHRGQEGAGIVSLNEGRHIVHRGPGLVGEVFNEKILKKMKGVSAIGHTRYSTQGADRRKNIQPLTALLSAGPLAVAHNGNIVNFPSLKKKLIEKGSIFYTSSDTECLIHLLARDTSTALNFENALKKHLPSLKGAYSFVLLTKNSLTAVRDPKGFRPLVLGQRKWKGGSSYMVASETCAFDLIGAEFLREIQPGEIWTVDERGMRSVFLKKEKPHRCIFEHVYFARPDSHVFSQNVYETRKAMGRILAEESPAPADLVVPVPDSGAPAAIGYSQASKIPYDMGIVRNHYIGRTFIHPSKSIRDFKLKIKLSAQKHVIKGKKVVLIDDSIVRGATSKAVVKMIRKAGAKEIHFRVSSPPVTGPCFYGVDTPEKSELISANKSVEEIRDYLQVESLAFLSHKGLQRAVQNPGKVTAKSLSSSRLKGNFKNSGFCSACFTGNYPV